MPPRIHTENLDGTILLRMDDGKANAMQDAFFGELMAALDWAGAEGARALVITGRERFFSGGLDLKALPALDRDALKSTLRRFAAAMLRVFLFPCPVVCAASGHALAGGMVLYMAGDLRIATADPAFRFGFNEVAIGLQLPHWLLALCGQGIPRLHHGECFLQAAVMDAAGTQSRGITHALLPTGEDLVAAALARARDLARLDPAAYGPTKRRLRLPAFGGTTGWLEEELDRFLTGGPFAASA